jgi:hypothetical protein
MSMINKINTAKFFKNKEFENINNLLIDISKKLFIEAYTNGGKEAGAVLNIDNLKYGIKKATNYNEVYFGDNKSTDDNECYKIMSESDNYSYMTIHTHNDISYFSVTDVCSLLDDDKVISISVINSNADIFILIKDKSKDYSTVKEYRDNMLQDYITPDFRKVMEENGLVIRRITL